MAAGGQGPVRDYTYIGTENVMSTVAVLDHFWNEFNDGMDAKAVVYEFVQQQIIPQSVQVDISNESSPKQQNQILHAGLKKSCTEEALMRACDIIIAVKGNPRMHCLGTNMKTCLQTGLGQTSSSSCSGQEQEQTPGALAGSEPTAIIPNIAAEYVDIKRLFVQVCEDQGSPTLDEVKDLCIDLIEGCMKHIPRVTCHEDDIEKAKTWTKLGRVICFNLSKWLSYDFFHKVVTHFQPALKIVKKELMSYEERLKHLVLKRLEHIVELQQREDAPRVMAEFVVKYRLNADGLLVKDLIKEKDFLAQRLIIPEHLLQVLSWEDGSIVITYLLLRDLLPLAELALCREGVRAELIQHGVEEVYLDSHPSKHPGPVDQSLQTLHLQRRAIVTALDVHHQDLDVTSLTSDLKGIGILTVEQSQKLVSLDDQEQRHEALLYSLLAHDGPDTFHKLVDCMGLSDTSTASDLQATFKSLVEFPGALSVISGSQCTPKRPVPWAGSQVVKRAGSQVVQTMRVGEVLDHFYDRFCDEMDASTIVWQLVQKAIIDDGDRTQITNVQLKRRVQNHILHACLKQKCTWDAFNTVCDMIINESGNVPMTALGRDMQRRLQTGT